MSKSFESNALLRPDREGAPPDGADSAAETPDTAAVVPRNGATFPTSNGVDDLDSPRPEESDPMQMPFWLTERVRQERARRADERAPGHVYHPALAAFFSNGWI